VGYHNKVKIDFCVVKKKKKAEQANKIITPKPKRKEIQ
jgi:hypothetical protein